MSEHSVGLLERDIRSNFGKKRKDTNPEFPQERVRERIHAMPNEYNKQPSAELRTFRDVIVDGHYDYTARIQRNLDYFSTTNDIEMESPRISQLQGYLDGMQKGLDDAPSTRLIIGIRGESPEAFALPDGTIYINQSLLNALDTLDEVVGVLGHEYKHILNKTFDEKLYANEVTKLGVCWAHETGSDLGAPELSEKVGFRSTGLASAIQKISSNQRGVHHQSGEMRAATVMGAHAAVHIATSNTEETPIPEAWQILAVEPTNRDVANGVFAIESKRISSPNPESLEEISPVDLSELFSKLCIEDLSELYESIETKSERRAFEQFARERLSPDFSDDEVTHFFIYKAGSKYGRAEYDSRLIASPENLVELARMLPQLENGDILSSVNTRLFGSPDKRTSPTTALVRYVSANFFIDAGDPAQDGVPVTEDTFLETLRIARDVPDPRGVVRVDRNIAIQECVGRYILNRYMMPALEDVEQFDRQGARAFFERVASANLSFDRQALVKLMNQYWPHDKKILLDIFPEQAPEVDVPKQIDDFFENNSSRAFKIERKIEDFLKVLSFTAKDVEMDEATRERYVQQIHARLAEGELFYPSDVRHLATPEQEEGVRKQILLWQLHTSVALFASDGEAFYRSVQSAMDGAGLALDDFTSSEIIDACKPLFTGSKPEVPGVRSLRDFRTFMELSYMRELKQKQEQAIAPTNIRDLLAYTQAIAAQVDTSKIFSDDMVSLLMFQHVQESFSHIVQAGIAPEERDAFESYVRKFLPEDATTRRILKQLAVERLTSQGSLSEKIAYLEANFEQLGYEGITLVADQITTLDEYDVLHATLADKIAAYLQPNSRTTELSVADNITSRLAEGFDSLLATASSNPVDQREISTDVAKKWFQAVFSGVNAVHYNPDTQKFNVKDNGKAVFRSLNDMLAVLHELPESQRTALVMKSLLDINGGLTTPESRAKLGKLTVDALRLPDGFIKQTLLSACDVADAKVVGYPLATLFSPVLFSGLHVDKVDINTLGDTYTWIDQSYLRQLMDPETIVHTLTAPTREVVEFGGRYREQPDSYLAALAGEGKDHYYQTYDALEAAFPEVTEDVASEKVATIDSSLEAVIKGVQASGAVGVRGMQLARQLKQFDDPRVEARLDQTFDANPGLNKLLFFENLYQFREKANAGDERYREDGAFVSERIVSIGDKLGGGSLYTTYAAVILDEEGNPQRGVLKQLNPNAELIIESFYKVALDTLERVKATGTKQEIAEAQQTLMLIELSQQWCLADINDPSFQPDDDAFRDLLVRFNEVTSENAGVISVSAPDRLYTSYRLKSEMQAEGRTLNAIRGDASVAVQDKEALVDTAVELFDFEINQPVSITEADGTTRYLMRSDPNPGNFVGHAEAGEGELSVIDRNLFLHLNESELQTIKDLWDGNEEAFFKGFVSSIFEHNKTSILRRPAIGLGLKFIIDKEIKKAGGREKIDPLQLMQSVMSKLDSKGLDVPLRMHLATKNVFAMKELQRRSGSASETDVPQFPAEESERHGLLSRIKSIQANRRVAKEVSQKSEDDTRWNDWVRRVAANENDPLSAWAKETLERGEA